MEVKQSKNQCSGCSACMASCPVQAIRMAPDEEGFLYPQVDSGLCVHCDICRKVCPFDEDYMKKIRQEAAAPFEQRYFLACLTDLPLVMRSRSGGAFYAIAKKVLLQQGAVYGVAMSAELEAVVTRIETTEQLPALQGSKYVQADMGSCISSICSDLQQGKTVLFAGTACQTAGVQSAIVQKRLPTQNLYTVDIICHGVPSPKVFRDNRKLLEQQWGIAITEVNFRDKVFGWTPHIESYSGSTKAGKSVKKYSNRYTSIFYDRVALRPGCHACRFCNFDRPADLTLADAWGSADATVGIPGKGISQIMVNTAKGWELMQGLPQLALQEVDRATISHQPNLFHPTEANSQRDLFWKLYRTQGYKAASDRFYRWIERIKLPYNRLKSRV